MADQNTLSDDEQKFFETGELPDSLAPTQQEAAAETIETAATEVTTPTEPVSPANDALELLRQSLQAEQQRAADAEARLRLMEEQANVKPTVAAPNPETDPLGAMMHQLNNVNSTVADLQAKLLQQQQLADQQQQIQNFQAQIKTLRDDFSKTSPDFPKAYEHFRKVQTEDMKAIGIPDAQIAANLNQADFNIAQNALRNGKNPAEVIYNMAKRHGYTPTATAPANQKIATLQAGAAAARAPQPSSPPAADITSEGLKNASDSDLDAMVRDDKAWAKLTGKPSNDIFH